MKEDRLIPDQDESSLILTPLLDLMFLVLIFFALNISFQSLDSLQVEVPENENIPSLEEESYLLIEITPGGKLYLEGEELGLDELRDEVAIKQSQQEDLSLFIAGDREIPYHLLMKVLDEIQLLGDLSIHLISQED